MSTTILKFRSQLQNEILREQKPSFIFEKIFYSFQKIKKLQYNKFYHLIFPTKFHQVNPNLTFQMKLSSILHWLVGFNCI